MFRVPGLTNGKMNQSITEFIDIYPTLCELAELEKPKHLEGQSLVNRLKKPGKKERDYAVSKYSNGVTLIEDDFFYTEWLDKNDSTIAQMLFNHSTDPEENINISERDDFASHAKKLKIRLREKRGASFIKPSDDIQPE
jgi:arylsulfatase A-like enzyme